MFEDNILEESGPLNLGATLIPKIKTKLALQLLPSLVIVCKVTFQKQDGNHEPECSHV